MDYKTILERIEQIKDGKREACIYGAGTIGKNFGLRLLLERGVRPSFYCDSNSALWGKEIVAGIKCISIDEMVRRNPICFVLVSGHYQKEVYDFVCEKGITDIVVFDELCEMKIDTYFDFKKRKQVAVYTCIVGGYDDLREPLCISDKCDYFLISDKAPTKQSVYKYINISECGLEYIKDNTRKNRYCKMMPHKFFSEYKYSIYVDGQVQIKSEHILNNLQELPSTRIIAYADNFWDCIYMEAMRAAEAMRDKKETIVSQVEKYWLEGMPEHFGSVLCPVLLREHNNPICVKLMNEWWEEVENYSRKDQISFPYVIWKNQYKMSDVGILLNQKENVWENEYVIWNKEHKVLRI